MSETQNNNGNSNPHTLQLLWFSNGDCPRHDSYVKNIIEDTHTNFSETENNNCCPKCGSEDYEIEDSTFFCNKCDYSVCRFD